jgi:hypothetical protein
VDNTQFGTLLAVIGGGLAGIATAIKLGLGRVAKSFDTMGSKFDTMATKHEGEEKALITLEGTVDECRADAASTLAAAREARDIVIERVGRRTGPRPATNLAGG